MNVPFCRIFSANSTGLYKYTARRSVFFVLDKNRVYDIIDNILSKKTKIIKKWLI